MTAPTRRSFLAKMTAVAALPEAVSGRRDLLEHEVGLSAPDGAASPEDESYWEQVRAQFAFREERVPMNAANLCPSPRAVADRV